MHLYEDQFSEANDFPLVEAPSNVFIIASTARCGSHMLGHTLYRTNQFGFPLEYANPTNLKEWERRLKTDDFHEVMSEIQRRRTSPNGVFSIKLHYPHIKAFGGFDKLLQYFPNAHFLLLSRSDALKQAVSLSIAKQTGVWISGQKPMNDNPRYNFRHIEKCLRETILNNASWRYVLAGNGCNYLEMDFDDIRQNLAQSIKTIANFVNVAMGLSNIPTEPATKKQSNTINAEWSAQFISDFGKSNELLDNPRPNFLARIGKLIRPRQPG